MIYTVALPEMEFFARHGLYDFERAKGNQFILTVKACCELPNDADFPSIDATLDYEKIYALVKPIMEKPEDLLEQVLVSMERSIRPQFPQLSALELSLMKRNPPMGQEVKSSVVTLHFSYI